MTFNEILIFQSQDNPPQSELRQCNMPNYISFSIFLLLSYPILAFQHRYCNLTLIEIQMAKVF